MLYTRHVEKVILVSTIPSNLALDAPVNGTDSLLCRRMHQAYYRFHYLSSPFHSGYVRSNSRCGLLIRGMVHCRLWSGRYHSYKAGQRNARCRSTLCPHKQPSTYFTYTHMHSHTHTHTYPFRLVKISLHVLSFLVASSDSLLRDGTRWLLANC